MNALNNDLHKKKTITIIGGGIAGIATAYQLAKKGSKVQIIDPNFEKKVSSENPNNGSQASLGILMGNIYQRTKGRS